MRTACKRCLALLAAADAAAYASDVSAAYASARTATLKKCAEIVRRYYPTLPC